MEEIKNKNIYSLFVYLIVEKAKIICYDITKRILSDK